jgi:CHAD domain-containing protein
MNWKQKSERLSNELLTTARKQVLRICDGLVRSPDKDLLNATHEVRKRIKKLRALLRLTRDRIGEPFQKRQNRTLRAIAHSLAPMRDTTAQVATCEKLHQHFPKEVPKKVFANVVKAITNGHSFSEGSLESRKELTHKLRMALKAVEYPPLKRLKKKDLRAGFKRAGRRYRKEYERARKSATDENLHAWRIRTKDLLNQLDIIRETLSKAEDKWGKRLEKLARFLGDDHDLAMLEHRLRELNLHALHQLEKPIHKWRQQLQKEAFTLARKL